MKQQFKLLKSSTILFALMITISNLSVITLHIANATYVEGPIGIDTVWTLVDSPFIISNDTIVLPNVTLTIEPSVEVRFGGSFSIIIQGKMVAEGTSNKVIKFTSNKLDQSRGDWERLQFEGSESLLSYCIIEHGINGIVLESGSLTLQQSIVSINSENGITVYGGNLEARNNRISNNTMNGIQIAGGDQVTVEDNVLDSNADGINLTSSLVGEIHIERNTILLNKQNGIVLAADAYDNTGILNNNITANLNGVLISTDTTTYITRNHVWNNTIGVLYTAGGNHEAHFNNIYSNSVGMNVAGGATVDATHNYWGDKSGPYHEGTNPYAKGNPVSGDERKFDFLLFLTAPIDYANSPPAAVLWSDKTLVAPNQTITFVGANSYDDGRVDYFTFDFNDSQNVRTTLTLFDYNYSAVGTYHPSLSVLDDFNVTSDVATTTVTVVDLAPLSVSVILSTDTVNFNENVTVTVYVTDGVSPVENASVTLFSVKGGNFDVASALTNPAGQITATFTAPNVTAITDIRIIARAEMPGYVDGSDYEYVRTVPPLIVQIASENLSVKSGANTVVNVDVSLGLGRPVKDALVVLSSDYGDISPSSNWTDTNGRTQFTFTAPQTLSQLVAALTATAMKLEYAEGHGQATMIVEPRILAVIATPSPPIIISGDTSTITVLVTSDGTPIPNATLATTTNIGEISPQSMLTDAAGMGSLAFTVSGPSIHEETTATIAISASKDGYVSNEAQANVQVVPKMLAVQITAQSSATYSEATVNLTAHVIYTFDMTPVSDVNVTIMSPDGGNFSRDNGLTDVNGDIIFVFQAPQANEQTDINITALASMSGYVNGQNYTTITVTPAILDIQINTTSETVASGDALVIIVYTTRNSTAVPNVEVTMATNYGNFSFANGITDSNGSCTFVFNAPQTETQLTATINTTVSKNGYINAENQTQINIIPAVPIGSGGGLTLTTILLIVIPIIVAVIVVVLVKLKVLSFSVKEEES